MDVYSTLVTYHEDCIHNAPAIKWLSLIDFYICDDFCSIPQKMDATSPLRLSAVYPLSCQWLMHHDQLCQTVAPLQPRKPHLTSAQDALQRVNLQ